MESALVCVREEREEQRTCSTSTKAAKEAVAPLTTVRTDGEVLRIAVATDGHAGVGAGLLGVGHCLSDDVLSGLWEGTTRRRRGTKPNKEQERRGREGGESDFEFGLWNGVFIP